MQDQRSDPQPCPLCNAAPCECADYARWASFADVREAERRAAELGRALWYERQNARRIVRLPERHDGAA